MENTKPHVGLLFLTSAWFREVGLQTKDSSLTARIDKISTYIVAELEKNLQIEFQGILYSEEDASAFGRSLAGCELDGLLIAPLMWCEDQVLLAALKNTSTLPILLCFFIPDRTPPEFLSFETMLKGSGSVGVLQISGYLKRAGYQYRSVTGHYSDERIYSRIFFDCQAMTLKKRLSQSVCGLLPSPCAQMHVTHVNDSLLKQKYGINLKYLSLQTLRDLALTQREEDIANLKAGYSLLSDGVSEEDFYHACRYALAVEQLIRMEKLDILAMNDVSDELHTVLGLRPCLENPRLTEKGKVICMEADVAAGIIMYVLWQWTKETPFYTEILNIDLENNTLLMGHAGYHSSINADGDSPVKLVTDIEYENAGAFRGVCIYFKYKPGPVTAVNCIYDGEKLRVATMEGESLPGPPCLEGIPHLVCQINLPVSEFYQKNLDLGVSQHWIIVPGRYKGDLERLCWWLNIEFIEISS